MSDHVDPLPDQEVGLTDIFVAGHPVGILIEKQQETIKKMQERIDELEEQVEENERVANNALGVAGSTGNRASSDGGENKTKVQLAKELSMNELVRRTLLDRSASQGASIPVAKVQDMARPDTQLHYQTVKDAWGEIQQDHREFAVGEKDGKAVLKVEIDYLTKAVVGKVEHSLGRDDLTKRLISRRKGGQG